MNLLRNLRFLFLLSSIFSSKADFYNWQQHIPPQIQQIIPDNFSSSNNNATVYGVHSLSGNIDISTYYGSLILKDADINSDLTVFGQLSSYHSSFKKNLVCSGPLTLKGDNDIIAGTVSLKGPLFSESMIFQESVEVFGYITAKDSIFKKSLILHSNKVELKDSTIEDLIIHDRNDKPAMIILDHVTVKGNILISSGQGNVFIKSSQVNKRQIKGYASIKEE